jgi:uncharacterized protein (DUF1330 family)
VTKGYIIVTEAIHDQEGMVAYAQAATPSFLEYGGTVLVMDAVEVLEGEWPGTRTVIAEFDSVAKAREWYTSADYGVARPIRQAAADCNVVIAAGVVSSADSERSGPDVTRLPFRR